MLFFCKKWRNRKLHFTFCWKVLFIKYYCSSLEKICLATAERYLKLGNFRWSINEAVNIFISFVRDPWIRLHSRELIWSCWNRLLSNSPYSQMRYEAFLPSFSPFFSLIIYFYFVISVGITPSLYLVRITKARVAHLGIDTHKHTCMYILIR